MVLSYHRIRELGSKDPLHGFPPTQPWPGTGRPGGGEAFARKFSKQIIKSSFVERPRSRSLSLKLKFVNASFAHRHD